MQAGALPQPGTWQVKCEVSTSRDLGSGLSGAPGAAAGQEVWVWGSTTSSKVTLPRSSGTASRAVNVYAAC